MTEPIDTTLTQTETMTGNREYTEAATAFDGTLDPFRLDLLYDAQTSGGMLVAVPADRLPRLLDELRKAGSLAAAVVGEVLPRRDQALLFTP